MSATPTSADFASWASRDDVLSESAFCALTGLEVEEFRTLAQAGKVPGAICVGGRFIVAMPLLIASAGAGERKVGFAA